MIYFCADDYGLSVCGNNRIENCIRNGILNKVSVIPNGEITETERLSTEHSVMLSLHINLVEGRPLSEPEDVGLLISDNGYFKYSFIGLFLLSLSFKRKELEKQLYTEIRHQLDAWRLVVGEGMVISIDSHQHTHMIPLVFKTLMRVIRDEGLEVEHIRIPSEPVLPYIFTPSLYLDYSPKGLAKQWLLKALAFANRREIKESGIQSAYFMGVLFSGEMDEEKIIKLLPHYLKLARKNNRNIELGFHPGYMENGEQMISGVRKDFKRFYFSHRRKIEFDTLVNSTLKKKEGYKNAIH